MNSNDDLPRDLARALATTPEQLAALHQRLADAAQADGLLDVAYRTTDSPVGRLLLAATETGLLRVAYASEDHDAVLQTLADRSCRCARSRSPAPWCSTTRVTGGRSSKPWSRTTWTWVARTRWN